MIIVDEGAEVFTMKAVQHRPIQAIASHAAIVEIFALDGAYMHFDHQNWSDNVSNLVTKRAKLRKMPQLVDRRELRSQDNHEVPICLSRWRRSAQDHVVHCL